MFHQRIISCIDFFVSLEYTVCLYKRINFSTNRSNSSTAVNNKNNNMNILRETVWVYPFKVTADKNPTHLVRLVVDKRLSPSLKRGAVESEGK